MARNNLGNLSAALLVIMLVLVVAPGTWAQSKYKTLYRFTGGSDGRRPYAGLIFDQAGNLYGTTTYGGNFTDCDIVGGCGVVFKLTPNSDGSWKESVLHTFCSPAGCGDGAGPYGSMIFDAAGNLYGTTEAGGSGTVGAVYELMPSNGGWAESVLYSFAGSSDGAHPYAGLIFDSSGNLYGTTSSWYTSFGGTVFELTRGSGGTWTESFVFDFTGGPGGGAPYAGVIFDAQGNLYGTTLVGGGNQVGVVFKLEASNRKVLQVLHSFTGGRDGGYPVYGSLIMDTAGNLYGTTSSGGAYNHGTVFKLTQSAGKWKETVVHSFTNERGAVPDSGLIFDSAGNLYGTTSQGGDLGACAGKGCGVVFKLTPNSTGGWKETVLYGFADKPGANPNAGLTLDSAGNLYGTTTGDNSTTFGSVFEITP